MKLSLVIATRNRSASIGRLFERLAVMPAPPDWELIVADNGSTDATPALLGQWAGRLPLRPVTVPTPGKSRALNLALQQARGELILFTDDDVAPAPDWLLRWAETPGLYPGYRLFGGRIRVDPQGVPDWILRSGNLQEMLISVHDLGEGVRPYPVGRYPIGPNMAVRRAALLAAGARWDEQLGPGTPVPLGDERAFLSQLSAAAEQDRLYVGTASVDHRPDPGSLTRARCWRRCYLGGLAAGRTDRRPGGAPVPVGGPALGRLLGCRGPSELLGMTLRAAGVAMGRLGR